MVDPPEVREILDRFDPLDGSLGMLCEKVENCRLHGQWDKAVLYCDQALQLAREAREPRAEGVLRLHRWAVHFTQKAYAQAVADCEHARQAFINAGDGCGELTAGEALGATHYGNGLFLVSRNNFVKAKEAFQTAMGAFNRARVESQEMAKQYNHGRQRPLARQCEEWAAGLDDKIMKAAEAQTDALTQMTSGGTPGAPGMARPVRGMNIIQVVEGPIAASKPAPTFDDIADYYLEIIGDDACIRDTAYSVHALRPGSSSELWLNPADYAYMVTRVHGDSMNQAGIESGDYVLLSKPRSVSLSPTTGDILAVAVNGTDTVATLKRYLLKTGKVVLSPESSSTVHVPIDIDPATWDTSVAVVGLAIAVLKAL